MNGKPTTTPAQARLQGWYEDIRRQLDALDRAESDAAAETYVGDYAIVHPALEWPEDLSSTDDVIAYLTLLRGILDTAGVEVRPGDGQVLELVSEVDGEYEGEESEFFYGAGAVVLAQDQRATAAEVNRR
jgi:hypothetical protein